MRKRPFILVVWLISKLLASHFIFTKRLWSNCLKSTHNSSNFGPLCFTLISGPNSPIWPRCHSLLWKLCQKKFWNIIPILRVRWVSLNSVPKWRNPAMQSKSVFLVSWLLNLLKLDFAVLKEKSVFKATVKSRRLFDRPDTLQWGSRMACLWKLTTLFGFAWCWKWPKLIGSRRAFSKAAFLTLFLCPSCFCCGADCKRLVPTLHRLIIILISMLSWMCITEQI